MAERAAEAEEELNKLFITEVDKRQIQLQEFLAGSASIPPEPLSLTAQTIMVST